MCCQRIIIVVVVVVSGVVVSGVVVSGVVCRISFLVFLLVIIDKTILSIHTIDFSIQH